MGFSFQQCMAVEKMISSCDKIVQVFFFKKLKCCFEILILSILIQCFEYLTCGIGTFTSYGTFFSIVTGTYKTIIKENRSIYFHQQSSLIFHFTKKCPRPSGHPTCLVMVYGTGIFFSMVTCLTCS